MQKIAKNYKNFLFLMLVLVSHNIVLAIDPLLPVVARNRREDRCAKYTKLAAKTVITATVLTSTVNTVAVTMNAFGPAIVIAGALSGAVAGTYLNYCRSNNRR